MNPLSCILYYYDIIIMISLDQLDISVVEKRKKN